MDQLYKQVLTHMERTVDQLARRVPQPKLIGDKKLLVFRHAEKTIYQAIVQKLARMVSTLHAARLLLNHGFFQEQASLQRILDEIQEDVLFLACGVIWGDNLSSLHRDYLDAFFEEEFDADTAIESTQKRPMIRRQKIHAYLARMKAAPMDPSRGKELFRTKSKIYSGYVHAASPHIMDMYGGNPPRFNMRGIKGSKIYETYGEDLWNYFYRGTSAFAFAAKAFGDDMLFDEIHGFMREFERASGRDYSKI